MRVPNNVGRAVQKDPAFLHHASTFTELLGVVSVKV